MPDSFTQVPPNSTGNKMRTRSRVIGSDTVHEQAVFQGALATYYAIANAVSFAANKHMISIFNDAGSGKLIVLKKLFLINNQISAATGAMLRQEVKRITALSAGTTITPEPSDSTNPALPAEVTIKSGGTATDGPMMFPLTFSNDEVGTTQAFPTTQLLAGFNWLPEGNEIQEIRLREGEGITVKNITNTAVGSFNYFVVFVVDEL